VSDEQPSIIVTDLEGVVHVSARDSPRQHKQLTVCDLHAIHDSVIPNRWEHCHDPLVVRDDLTESDVTCLGCLVAGRSRG
jgi:hypothetical protein